MMSVVLTRNAFSCYSEFMDKIKAAIKHLPLKEMESTLLLYEILEESKIAGLNVALIDDAIRLASYLHRNDIRQARGKNLTDNYINHPLRNTLRLMRYGCFVETIIIASILHDTVEDHALEIVMEFGDDSVILPIFAGDAHAEQVALQVAALEIISNMFGVEVARIVRKVSNAPSKGGLTKDQKRAEYAKHVIEAIEDDAPVFLVKFSDFSDNAIGLYHNKKNSEMVAHLSRKYLPLIEPFVNGIKNMDLPIHPDAKNRMLIQLKEGQHRLMELMK